MRTTILCVAFGALLVAGVACGSPDSTSPDGSSPAANNPPTPSVPAPPTQSFPAPIGPSRTFVFDHELKYPVSGYTKDSRFVLYDNGAFALGYTGLGAEYRGGFTEPDGVIVLN